MSFSLQNQTFLSVNISLYDYYCPEPIYLKVSLTTCSFTRPLFWSYRQSQQIFTAEMMQLEQTTRFRSGNSGISRNLS